MPLHASEELGTKGFAGGIQLELSPEEIAPNAASSAENVDLAIQYLRKRLGKTQYNSTEAAASPCIGGTAFYPNSGSRSILLATATAVYADANQDGDFGDASETLASGLSSRTFVDFLDWRNNVYMGDGVNSVYKWPGSSTASAVAILTAPAAAPECDPIRTIICDFETASIASWAADGSNTGNVARAYATRTESVKQGTGSLKLTATGSFAGDFWQLNISSTDLSKAEELSVWVKCTRYGPNFQIGVSASSTVDYSLFPIISLDEKNVWQEVRVPLTALAPQDRTAITYIGIRLVDEGGASVSATKTCKFFFDEMRAVGPFYDDVYYYYYTYAEIDSTSGVILRESNPYQVSGIPSPAKRGDTGTLDVTMPPALAGIAVSGVYTNQSGVTHVMVYRYRETGFSRAARLIDKFANVSGTGSWTYNDYISDSTVELEARAEMPWGKQAPPVAQTYAIVNSRMLAGNVTISATPYPYRLYLSVFEKVEEFSARLASNQVSIDPLTGGWIDLGDHSKIQRIIEFDGMAIIFTDRSIWTLEGSGWDDFQLRKRADIGLSARNAVAVRNRYVFFLAGDGMRVLIPNRGFVGEFPNYLLSEPIESLLRAIPAGYRSKCAMGIDERDRVELAIVRAGQTVSDAAVVFDPRIPGAMADGFQEARPGWTYYTSRGHTAFFKLKRGVLTGSYADQGQLMGCDTTTGKVHYLNRSSSDADIETDNGSAIAWNWTSAGVIPETGRYHELAYINISNDTASGLTVTATPVLEGAASATTYMLQADVRASGRSVDTQNLAATIRATDLWQMKLSGSHSAAFKLRSLAVGYNER